MLSQKANFSTQKQSCIVTTPCLLYVTWYDFPPTWLYEAVLLISSLEKLVVDVSHLAVFCRFHSTRMWSLQPPLYVWTVISLLPSSSECVSFVLGLVYQVRATCLVGLVVRRRWRTAFIMTSIPVKINQFGVVGRWVGGCTYTHTHTHQVAILLSHTHTHACTHTHPRTHARTYACAHTHTHMLVGVESVCVLI